MRATVALFRCTNHLEANFSLRVSGNSPTTSRLSFRSKSILFIKLYKRCHDFDRKQRENKRVRLYLLRFN